ncbi:MAG: magnesium transporter [Bacteroidetes bacterium]|nr:magnesium transporter [Bacteroidota bacterium]
MDKVKNNTTNFHESILLNLKSKDIDSLKQILNSANELDLLNILHNLSAENQVIIYRLLSKDKALTVFEQLDTNSQQKLIRSFTEEAAIEIIEELEPNDRVRLLDELPAKVAKKMLEALSPSEREITNLLMGYETETAGRIMTPQYVQLKKDITVSEALEYVKKTAKDKETIYTLYITDITGILEGVVTLRDLFIADPAEKVEKIMQKYNAKVSTDTDQEEVARLLKRLNLLAIPVVDKENRMVGIITVDDAIDILEDEATEDILNMGGLADVGKEKDRSDVLINGSLWSIWKIRLPFLIITLAGGLLAGLVIDGFEETLQAIAAVAIFIPLIMDMGGSVGTQSTTVFARGLALGQIEIKNFLKPFLKEIGVGLSIGSLIGFVSGLVAFIWQGEPMLGVAVGIALVATMTLAACLGFFVPYVLVKLNADQAAGSAPIITSIKDITGLIVYFLLVSALLGHLM